MEKTESKPSRVMMTDPEKQKACCKEKGKIANFLILLILLVFCLLLAVRSWSTSDEVRGLKRSLVARNNEIELINEALGSLDGFAWDEDASNATAQFSRLVRTYERSDCAEGKGCTKYSEDLAYYYASHEHLNEVSNNNTDAFTKLTDSEYADIFHHSEALAMGCRNDVYKNHYNQLWCDNEEQEHDTFITWDGGANNHDQYKFHYWKAADFMPSREQYPKYPYELETSVRGETTRVKIIEEGIYLLFASIQFRDSVSESGMSILRDNSENDDIIGKCTVSSPPGDGTKSYPCNIFQVAYFHADDRVSVAISAYNKFKVDKSKVYLGFMRLKVENLTKISVRGTGIRRMHRCKQAVQHPELACLVNVLETIHRLLEDVVSLYIKASVYFIHNHYITRREYTQAEPEEFH